MLKPAIKRITLFASLLFTAASAFAQTNFELMVSTESYNRLMFPVAFEKIVIPPDAQLKENPISLKDNLGLLLRPEEGARPISVFIQLVDGRAFNIKLIPSSSPEGAVFRYDNADDASVKPFVNERPDDGWIADVFVMAAQGKKPVGFEESKEKLMPIKAYLRPAPNATGTFDEKKLNQINMQPLARYIGSGYVLSVFRVSSKKMLNIEPRDFYRKGIVAVTVDGDVISSIHQPLVVVLEAKSEQ